LEEREGVPLPSGEGIRGAERLRRWDGREANGELDGEMGKAWRRDDAVRAIPVAVSEVDEEIDSYTPGTAPALLRGILAGVAPPG
jgi:hypothetical protein